MKTRILIVDDEPKWMQFTREDLGTMFEVEVAADLTVALAQLKQKSYDLIIASSCRLDVLHAISEKYSGKRIVVVTGQPTTREAIIIYRLGVLDYFAKDFRREVVSQKIREAIQKPVKIPTAQ